jgi:hypothetical protein
MVDDPPGQPQHVGVFHLAGQQLGEDGMVDARKELADVGLPHPGVAASEVLAAAHGGVSALALAAGVAVGQEGAFPDRFEDVDQGVMDDAIGVRRGADKTIFRIGNIEIVEWPRRPGAIAQLGVQVPQVVFQPGVEGQHGRLVALAAGRLSGRPQQVGKADQVGPEIADAFHADCRGWVDYNVCDGTCLPHAGCAGVLGIDIDQGNMYTLEMY